MNGSFKTLVEPGVDNNVVLFRWAKYEGYAGLYLGNNTQIRNYTLEFCDPEAAQGFVNFCNLGSYTTVFGSKVMLKDPDINVTEVPLSGDTYIVGDN